MNQVLLTVAIIAAPIFIPYLIGRAVWSIIHANDLVVMDDPENFIEHYGNGWPWILVLAVTSLLIWGAYVLAGILL
jgi:hypothetical protein